MEVVKGRPRKYTTLQICPCGKFGEVNGNQYFRPLCSTCRKATVKLEVITHYGNGTPNCVSCGFSNIDALCIDHVNNDGSTHRKTLGSGSNYGGGIYYWLRAHNYPAGFQTLCMNCNMIKEIQRKRK